MRFHRYHGLGNDYLVMDPLEVGRELSPREIRLVCHRNYGVGSDGILFGPLPSTSAAFRLRIFNPDASEAEKSGNGLRIFSRFLFDRGLVRSDPFTIETAGGVVRSRVRPGGREVEVEMGRVTFDSTRIPVSGPPREVLNAPSSSRLPASATRTACSPFRRSRRRSPGSTARSSKPSHGS